MTDRPTVDRAPLLEAGWAVLRRKGQAFAETDGPEAYELATGWYADSAWEVRSFAVAVLGRLAARDEHALAFLFERCGTDPAWQVNEALAMAFNDVCAAIGYQEALPIMQAWLRAPSASLRRAVSEGLRPWTAKKRDPFAKHPELAIELLGTLKDDESRYVQESVGNALRDISRNHFSIVLAALEEWIAQKPDSKSRRTIARFALKHAVKDNPTLSRLSTRPKNRNT